MARRDSQSCLSAATLYLDRLGNVTTLYSIVLDGLENVTTLYLDCLENVTTLYLDRLQNVTTLWCWMVLNMIQHSIVQDGLVNVLKNETTSYACLVPHSRLQF